MTIAMTKLIVTLLLGVALYKTKVIDKNSSTTLSRLVINVTSPIMVLSSVSSAQGNDSSVTTLLVAGTIIYVCSPFLGYMLTKLLKTNRSSRAVYAGSVIFPNFAFMGYPIVQALFGDKAVFYTSILHLPSGLLFFTFQMFMMRKCAEEDGLLHETNDTSFTKFKKIVSNGLVASLSALFIYFFNISFPAIITETLDFIGGITMPLSMIAIGCNIAQYNLKDIFGDINTYIFSAVRLLFCPLLTYFAASFFLKDPVMLRIIALTFGMPVAALMAMGSAEYENQRKQASVMVAFTTIFSAVTIPLLALLIGA